VDSGDLSGLGWRVMVGSCLDRLKELPDASVDAVVTDPPYELGFMGKSWDSSGIAFNTAVWLECLRVLKPGGHLLSFSGTRTYHRMTVAIEDAGFEVRDMIAWISNKTFPKSHNVGKSTDNADWAGWGTGLKPSLEPVVMARKPLVGTVAANVLEFGTGALNIDGTRIPGEVPSVPQPNTQGGVFSGNQGRSGVMSSAPGGRWPSNVVLDEFTAGLVDEQSGQIKGGTWNTTDGARIFDNDGKSTGYATTRKDESVGGASRFFYVARASKYDRNEGVQANPHPTVKPTDLMRQFVRLVTPPGGVVLDPFTGSGSTGKAAILEGFEFIGCELTEEYLPIIEGRLNHAVATVKAEQDKEKEKLF
jgi:hypothetical protein